MYSTKLSEALTAMQAIRDTADMHILASENIIDILLF